VYQKSLKSDVFDRVIKKTKVDVSETQCSSSHGVQVKLDHFHEVAVCIAHLDAFDIHHLEDP